METLDAVLNAAKTITLSYPHDQDGRITSAVSELPFIKKLKEIMGDAFDFEIPKTRHWYDCKVNGIHINVKITAARSGDDAFNKKSLLLTWGGRVPEKEPGNFNNLIEILKNTPQYAERDPFKEYYFLVVYKKTGDVILKSLLDVKTYICNISGRVVQINWKNELKDRDYKCSDRKTKSMELLRVVHTACRRQTENMIQFVNFDIESLT